MGQYVQKYNQSTLTCFFTFLLCLSFLNMFDHHVMNGNNEMVFLWMRINVDDLGIIGVLTYPCAFLSKCLYVAKSKQLFFL